MNHKIITFLAALLAFAAPLFAQEAEVPAEGGVNFVEGKTFAEILNQAREENKIVFIDCYTSWCGPCKMMANQVFPQKIMGDYFNPRFVCVKFDMEKGEGVDLKTKYDVKAFPTFLCLDADGNELHRVVGGDRDCQAFIDRVDAVNSGNTTVALARRYENGERDRQFLTTYLKALETAYDRQGSAKIAEEILAADPAEMLADSTLFQVFVSHENNLYSDNFQYLLANSDKFADRYSARLVNRKMENVWMRHPGTLVSRSEGKPVFDKEGMNRYKAELKKWKPAKAKQYAADADITVARSMGNWKDFTKFCSGYMKKYDVSDMTLYNWVRSLNSGCKDPKLRATAAKWVEKRLEMFNGPDADPNFKSAFEAQVKQLKGES